jgi:hypothetical protein
LACAVRTASCALGVMVTQSRRRFVEPAADRRRPAKRRGLGRPDPSRACGGAHHAARRCPAPPSLLARSWGRFGGRDDHGGDSSGSAGTASAGPA